MYRSDYDGPNARLGQFCNSSAARNIIASNQAIIGENDAWPKPQALNFAIGEGD
ncbi:hypothetical protein [Microcoleus sp. D3_18a_C4]|uniref:hypothetical protein n=1 Tax=Microcoleus sp. D3_18a_C4 TaxID=3055332 RepID=UPI002FD3BDB7